MKKVKIIEKKVGQRGITLVALVVTIIIMLILAGVTFRLALGENGLFNMSEKAVEKYKEEAEKEENSLKKGSEELANIIEDLNKPDPIDVGEITANPKKYYGEYVKYGVDLNGDEDYTNDWKLFYVGGKEDGKANGRIYIIAADYVPMENETLKTAMGDENNGARMFPETSSDYETLSANWGSSVPAYQKLSDLIQNPMELFMHTGYNIDNKQSIENSKCVSTLLNTVNWQGFVNGAYYGEAAIGGPTLEMWCAAWNAVVDESDENNLVKVYVNGNGTSGNGYYWGTSKDTTNSNYTYMNGMQSEMQKLTKLGEDYPVFFPHITEYVTTNGVSGKCGGYWLASPSAYDPNYMIGVRFYGLIGSYRYDSSRGNGLRPLVCLQDKVKLQKNTAESNEEKTVYDIVK